MKFTILSIKDKRNYITAETRKCYRSIYSTNCEVAAWLNEDLTKIQLGGAGFHHIAGLELHRHVKNTGGSEVYLGSATVFKHA